MTATLTITMDNAAFEPVPRLEVIRILEQAMIKLSNGGTSFTLYDSNGNDVGKFEVTE